MATVGDRCALLQEATCHCCGMPCLSCDIEGYRQCTGCRAWKSVRPVPPAELYTDDYWSHERGHSTIGEQWNNLTLPIHVEEPFLVAWVRQAVKAKPPGSRLLEIGCAPGAFLYTMAVKGWAVHGQEAARGTCDAIAERTGLPAELFTAGLFPDVAPPGPFDLIVAFDVLEHAPDPVVWLRAARRLLGSGGVLLLQVPVFAADDPGEITEDSLRLWEPDEHVYVFTPAAVRALLARAGFGDGGHDSTHLAAGHDLLVVRTK